MYMLLNGNIDYIATIANIEKASTDTHTDRRELSFYSSRWRLYLLLSSVVFYLE
jgi:hypothetical protein